MEVVVGRARFVVTDDENAAFWHRVVAGDWEPDSFRVLDRMLFPGCTFVDVGAWIGPLTLYAATIAGCCHAFEPDPVARAALEQNLLLNPDLARHVIVHPEAVAAHPGQVQLGNITSDQGGDSMSSLLFDGADTGWDVKSVTLREVLTAVATPHAPRLGLVKIDIEGSEAEVLAAARDLIEDQHPPLFLSVHARFWEETGPRQERLEVLASVLSCYPEVLTASLEPMTLESMFDQEHRGGLFELLACPRDWPPL